MAVRVTKMIKRAMCSGAAAEAAAGRRSLATAARAALCVATVLLVLGRPAGLPAQNEPVPADLLARPFDELTLTEQHGSRVLRVQRLEDLPQRRPPVATGGPGRVRVRLLERPQDEFEIAWRDIAQIRLHEQFVLERAQELTRAGRHREAFRHFSYLLEQAADFPGLQPAVRAYLFENAAYLNQQSRPAQALAVLEELYRKDPEYGRGTARSVVQAIDRVGAEQVGQYVAAGEHRAARQLIQRLGRSYGLNRLPELTRARDESVERAAAKRDEAREHLQAGRLPEADEAVREMLRIWPEVADGRAVAAEVSRRFPKLVVAVRQLAAERDGPAMLDWDARRTARLRARQLVEMLGVGAEGGMYVSPWGVVRHSEDRTELEFQLRQSAGHGEPPAIDAYAFARRLLSLADPEHRDYRPNWAQLAQTVAVESLDQVRVHLRRSFVLPEAALRVGVGEAAGERGAPGPYVLTELNDVEARYEVHPQQRTADYHPVAEITEWRFEEPRRALEALRRGEVDIVDRVSPADVAGLAEDADVVVAPYAVPTLHLLVPSNLNPLTANGTFRRALAFGIDRQAILHRALLRDQSLAGCQVISGPFPAGIDAADAAAYAYDQRIQPRAYDPRFAKLLVALAEQQLRSVAERRGEPAPDSRPLVLAHPADADAQLAAELISRYLSVLGVDCRLKELPPDARHGEGHEWDLLYVEVAMAEPVIDIDRLFSDEGLGPSGNAYVDLGLRQLREARDWREVRQRLLRLHQTFHDELPVIPLWQLTEYVAYHRRVGQLGTRPVTLYQDVERWQVAPPPLSELDEDPTRRN